MQTCQAGLANSERLTPIGERTDDDLVDVAAGQHAERALVQVHDRQVRAAPVPYVLIGVQPHKQEVARRPRRLQRRTAAQALQQATVLWLLRDMLRMSRITACHRPLLLRCSNICDQSMSAHAFCHFVAGAALRSSPMLGLEHLQDLHVARVQQVEGAVDVDDARVWRRGAPVAELHDAARGGQEARD